METKLNQVLSNIIGRAWEATAEKLSEDQRPRIGVSWEGFGELGAEESDREVWFHFGGIQYRVVPVKGLSDHDVALIL